MTSTKKIVLVGHFNVGKSSMIRRFVQNVFSDDYLVSIGVHILKKTVTIANKELTLVIWDIEGKESIDSVRESYLLGTSGFIYVIDPTRTHTYENLASELKFLSKKYPKVPIVTVCNKADLVDIDHFGQELSARELAFDFATSAKTGANIESIFFEIAKKMD